jgi:hypothetical protein
LQRLLAGRQFRDSGNEYHVLWKHNGYYVNHVDYGRNDPEGQSAGAEWIGHFGFQYYWRLHLSVSARGGR